MKKIILSVAVAAMALTTTASALEDIKVNGQAKLWYESNDMGDGLLNKDKASGETVMKIGVTGKQGNIGFGATMYQTSTMGIEGEIVSGVRTNTSDLVNGLTTATTTTLVEDNDNTVSNGTATSSSTTTGITNGGQPFFGEAYITAPMGSSTVLKFGKQELNTPLAFTEKWNATPNTFNGAVAINSSVKDLTLIGAYVGQVNTNDSWKTETNFNQLHGGAYAVGALYKNDSLAVNFWGYKLNNVLNVTNISANAYWVDAGMKMGDASVKAYFATVSNSGKTGEALTGEALTGFAVSADMKVAGWTVFGAFSSVGEGELALANTATGFKKTKLPTAGVYTDGLYVAQPEATAMKIKAAGKVGDTKLIAQFVNSTNASTALSDTKDTTEIDLIAVTKVGDFNIKGILINRTFANTTANTDAMHLRAIVSLNF